LVVDVFVSVDGWAGSDGLPGYFGYLGPELADWIAAEGAAPQVVLMGRRTYLMLADLPEEVRDEGWHRLSRLEKVVFSRSLTEASWSNTRICSGDLVDEVRGLKAGSEVPLRTVGSLSVARQLLAAGLVALPATNRLPAVHDAATPLADPPRQFDSSFQQGYAAF